MRALVPIASGFVLGAWLVPLGVVWRDAWLGCVAVLGVSSVIAASTRRAASRPNLVAAVVLVLGAGVCGHALGGHAARPRAAIPAGIARFRGVVERRSRGEPPGAVVRVLSGHVLRGGERLPAGARVAVAGLEAPVGQRLRLLARVGPLARFVNRSPHPDLHTRVLEGRGHLIGRPRVEAPAGPLAAAVVRARRAVREGLTRTLPTLASGLGRALLLGESNALPPDARGRVRGAGLAHVLAVSGLHVTLLAGAVVLLLGWLLRRFTGLAERFDVRRAACWAGPPAALVYALVVGDAPSAWRAAITASIGFALLAGGRRPTPASVAAAAAVVSGVIHPDDLLRPGFALSIVATASLVAAPRRPPARAQGTDAERGDSWLRAGLEVTVRTTVATAPLVVWWFGGVPLIGVLANVVVVPLAAGLVLPVMIGHAGLAALAPPLAAVSAPLADVSARAFFAAADAFAAVPLGRDLPPLSVPQGLALAVGCVALLSARRHRTRAAIVGALVVVLGLAEAHLRHVEQPTGGIRAAFLDVGQGDAALVDLPDGRLMLFDAGGSPSGGPDPGERVLVPLLRARRRERIDIVVLSHPHPDHYGGLSAVLDAFEVGELWDTGQSELEEPDGAAAALVHRARGQGAVVRSPDELCRGPVSLGAGAVARVHWPCPSVDSGFGPNNNSLVVELSLGARRLLFTGDIEGEAERALSPAGHSGLRPVDVLKVPHHGSRTSSSEALLARTRPRVAIASLGRQNRFGHPHRESWDRLSRRVPCLLRTDRDGGVTVWTDGVELRVEAAATSGPAACERVRSRE